MKTAFTCLLLYARLLALLLFFLKHMACHAFTHEISDWNKYLSVKFFHCVQIEPHSSSLTNAEIVQVAFVSSSIFAVEKKKENIGNCKAFCFTCKRNKTFDLNMVSNMVSNVLNR